MPTPKLSDEVKQQIKTLLSLGYTHRHISRELKISTGVVSNVRIEAEQGVIASQETSSKQEIESEYGTDAARITVRSLDIKTLDDALRVAKVDSSVWEVDRYIVNSWETTMGAKSAGGCSPQTYTNFQVKVWLKRKAPEVRSLEILLGEIQKNGPVSAPKPKAAKANGKFCRELEVSIVDPHLGLHCFEGGSDHNWDIETCEQMVLDLLQGLLESAKMYGPFSRIILPMGNDYFHADNVFHTTTQGTGQPESDSWQYVYVRGEKLAIKQIELCKAVAPVEVKIVPGNHDRQSVFTLGRLLNAYYHRDDTVSVDATASPYKFHHFGVNLIGFEHGHSIRDPIRLAALMANECRDIWSQTVYREWHLGDQHRKGSSKPSTFEEQGVSVEYLPGLTPSCEWARLKSFNWQKRAGMAFVWDHDAGPIARLQININSYTGKVMRAR
jgi:hypothetical protein